MSGASTKKLVSNAAKRRPMLRLPSGDSSRFGTWLRSIWRQRWLSIVSAWILCIVGWTAVAIWPSHYVSSAVVYADLNRLAGQQAVTEGAPSSTDLDENPVRSLSDILLSYETLAEIEDRTDLSDREAATLRNDILIRATAPALFVASYYHKDAKTARQVLDVLFTSFGASIEDIREEPSADTKANLQRQMSDLQMRILAAEANLAEFEQTTAALIDEPVDDTTDIATLEEEALGIEQQIKATLLERDEIAERLAQLPSKQQANEVEALDAAALERRTAELANLEVELASLRDRYADSHPYVSELISSVEAIEEELGKGSQLTSDNVTDSSSTTDDGDIEEQLAELREQHDDKIADLAKLNNELAKKRQEIEHLSGLTEGTSSVEAEKARLEGAVDDLKVTLGSLAAHSDKIQQQTDRQSGERAEQAPFKLINSPSMPDKPTGPSRLICLALVLLLGVGIGGAAAVIRNRSKGVFESAWQLKQRFDVGVLGTISEVLSPSERKRLSYSRLAFGLCCFGLIGLFSGLAIAESMNLLTPWGERLRVQLLG